jgi:VWFA-related protein
VEGRDTMIGPGSGPLGQEAYVNDTLWQTSPLSSAPPTASGHNNAPVKQVHPLNDAILMAAQKLSTTEAGRRRVVFVISDGREYGSKAKYKEVVQYLQEHKIAVYGTLVGDSATWGLGFLDRVHLPLMMADNILPQYSSATGGQFDAEFSIKGIERSFSAIAEQVRTQYTIGYYSHESILDGKYRAIEVQVTRPGFTVIAKPGYYPSAPDRK